MCSLTFDPQDIDQWNKVIQVLGTPPQEFFKQLQPSVGGIMHALTSSPNHGILEKDLVHPILGWSWDRDTSLYRTLHQVPKVSTIEGFHCIQDTSPGATIGSFHCLQDTSPGATIEGFHCIQDTSPGATIEGFHCIQDTSPGATIEGFHCIQDTSPGATIEGFHCIQDTSPGATIEGFHCIQDTSPGAQGVHNRGILK